jgi:Protein of unknown function (DUF1559)
MSRILVLCVLLVVCVPAAAQPSAKSTALPPDLAAVPNDAFAFAHVKLADLWKNDALKDVRAILQKAGPKAIEAFDKRFTPAPSSVERLTVYMPPPNFMDGPGEPDFVFLLSVNKPFDRDKFLKQLGKTTERKGRLGAFMVDEDESIGVRFLDEKTLAIGTVQAIQHMVDTAPPMKAGPLTPALELAAGQRPIVAALNATAFPVELVDEVLRQGIPEPLHPLFRAQSVTLSMDLDGDGHIYARVTYPDGQATDAAEKAVGVATEMARTLIAQTRKQLSENVFGDGKDPKIEDLPFAAGSLLGLGALQHAEDLLNAKPVKREGDSLAATVPLPPAFKSALGTAAVAGSMMAPAVGKLKQSATRAKGANNLKQIGLALHNYHDTHEAMPPASIVDKKGKPMLSWRVMILPFIDQDALYREFKLDEPWDSEHNKKLIEKMPPVYALPIKGASKPGHTHYRVLVGGGSMWDWVQGTKFVQISDGLSNTIIVVEAEEGVPWTKPDELEFDPQKAMPKFGKAHKGGFYVLFGDGSVRFLNESLDAQTMKALITMAGGEVVNIP